MSHVGGGGVADGRDPQGEERRRGASLIRRDSSPRTFRYRAPRASIFTSGGESTKGQKRALYFGVHSPRLA